MTGNATNAKSEALQLHELSSVALQLHELSSEELNAVSGGRSDPIRDFERMLQELP